MKMGVQIAVIRSQAQACQPAATRNWERQTDSSLEPLEGGGRPCQHLDFGLLVSRTVGARISVVFNLPSTVGILKKLIQWLNEFGNSCFYSRTPQKVFNTNGDCFPNTSPGQMLCRTHPGLGHTLAGSHDANSEHYRLYARKTFMLERVTSIHIYIHHVSTLSESILYSLLNSFNKYLWTSIMYQKLFEALGKKWF